MSKREKAAVCSLAGAHLLCAPNSKSTLLTSLQQPKKASVSEQWATIPAPRADDLPKMKRDYQALALANSLDPKRFMKGQGKLGRVPERFNVSIRVQCSPPSRCGTIRTASSFMC